MNSGTIFPAGLRARSWTLRRLARPSTLLILLSNLIPIFGVWAWGWDAFLLLMLYWMETVVIAFWTMARFVAPPPGAPGARAAGSGPGIAPRLLIAAMFTFHAGCFMAVHFFFLWAIFSGEWASKVNGVGGFFTQVVAATGLWAPVVVMFIGYGLAYLHERAGPGPIGRPQRADAGGDAEPAQPIENWPMAVVGGLYRRIIIMQLAIIFGAWLSIELGSMAPLVLLIALKTVVDLVVHLATDPVGARAGPVTTAAA